jgi:heme/copper-type cytochrome/quinol oxidase subunit 2
MSDFHFGHIVIIILILFFVFLFPMMFFGYRFGLGKRSKDHENKGCWKAVFMIGLLITIIVVLIIAGVTFLATEMTRH